MTKLEKIGRLESKALRRSAKRSQRKDELADAAISALKQLGYARTSLRDIAELSGVSVGMLHYYFVDKTDLITFCVRKYKESFVAQLDSVMKDRAPDTPVADAFAEGLCDSIRYEAESHRLWYDIRSQALFDADFHGVVQEIESDLLALVTRLFEQLGLPQAAAIDSYLSLDGAFRYYLQRHLGGDADALTQLKQRVIDQLAMVRATAGS